jgi:hypothetical protein
MITDPDKIARIRAFLGSTLWNEDLKPAIAQRGGMAIKALCRSPDAREGEFKNTKDEDLRAIIREAEFQMVWWENEVKVFDHNQARDELARQQQEAEAGLTPQPSAP